MEACKLNMQAGKTILMVEDDKYIALALKIRLQAEGYEVQVAYGFEEARKKVDAKVPDIALVDFNLPDGNGIDLISSFMKDPRTASISAMIMTASKKSGLREQAMAQGAAGFFEKPFKSTDLIDSLKNFNALNEQVAV